MRSWIYDLVEEALFYEIYENPDNSLGEYEWVTDRIFDSAIEDCAEYIMNGDNSLPMVNPSWQDEESAHHIVLDWMGSYFL